MKRYFLLISMLITAFALSACGGVNITIHFDTDGGTEIESITTDGASTINIPNNPEKEGFVFDGWYWDEGTFLRPFTANSLLDEPISGDLTVYAKWLPESLLTTNFEVTFDSQGGSAVDTQTVIFRDKITEPDEPTRLGYLFAGWFKDRNYNDEWDFITGKVENNITLYAKWNVISEDYHIVHFVSNFDVEVPSQQVLKGSALIAPNISREGYTLEGWYTSLNNGATLDEKWSFTSNVVNANFTLYAKWTINQYTISFESNGGSLVNAITRDYGTSINQPQNPFKSGYIFGGWYVDQSLETLFDFGTMPANNLTLYALWLRTLSFETNGAAAINSVTFRPGENLMQPNTPSKIGHTFAGWYTNTSLTTPFTFGSMPDLNLTLYAKWTVNSYTISFEMNGGSTINSLTLNYDSTINITSDFSKVGHTFIGWYTDASLTTVFNLTKMPAEDLTLYAKWEINSYTISFETNGGSVISSITQVYDTILTAPEDPIREGHTFAGWYIDAELNTPFTFSTVPAADTVLYAKWTVNIYTLSYLTNTDASIDVEVIPYGTALSLEHELTKVGYTFAGWYTDQSFETQLSFDQMPAYDLTLYAKWSRSITFMSNGGSDIDMMVVDPGETIIAPSDPMRTGYTFIGWYSDEALINPFVFSVMPDNNLTLYAKWDINQYTITFDSNGGSVVSSITQDYESIVTAPNHPEKEGYTFTGWTIDLEGNNDYTFDTMPANDLTLYAQWQINAYTITFDTGEGTTVDSITQDYQTALTKPADPTRLFYTFDGWYEDQEYTILYSFNLMEARDLILYAKWLPNEFMITLELNGGMGETTLIERYTLPIEAPHPEKEGYTFDGWFTDAALTNPYVFSTMPPQNFTLYAKWNINAYTITFESYGGTTYNPIIKIYNTSMPAIEDPIKEGYTFTGWFLDESFTDVYAYSNMPARNITLYARWHNSITFDSNGGSLVDTITLASGSTVNEPSDPIKLGHTFIGWYEDIDLTIPYVFSTMPEPNITIYAKWEVNQYIIGFEPNGGDYVETISQDFGTELILPIPVRTGYSFMGWYKDDELTQVVEFTTVQAANMVLYAKWEINQYSIYFKTNDVESVETITQDYGTEFELPTIAKEGHTFVGWYIDESMTQLVDFSTIQANDIVMYAKWEINNYYINYYDIKQDLLGLTLVYGEKIIDFTSGEQHFGVLTNFNRVIVWGLNSSGQLGIGNTISSEIPMDITNNFNLLENENIVFVKFSENTSSALTSSGRVFFWGSNSNGILGIGLLPSSETINTHSPIDISTSFNLSIDELVTSIYLGDNNASVITSNNRVFIWGSNEYGQLGNGTLIDQSSPIDITDRFNFIDDYPIHMSLGTFHSALVTHQGKVYLWGRNNAGQIGILAGTSSSSIKTPLDITTHFNLDEDDKIVKVSLGYFHSGVITLKGNVYTWGAGGNGQLGNGNLYHTHIKQNITEFFNLDNNEKIVNLELDYFHSSGFTSFGRIFVWGWNSYGQLGNSSGNIVSPYEISNIVNIGEVNKIASFSVEESTTAIITEFGKIYILGIYNINKGSYSPINVVNYQYQLIYTETYDYNQEIILYTPQNESLIFDGWYDDEELMSKFTDSNMSTSNILLYGFWKKYD